MVKTKDCSDFVICHHACLKHEARKQPSFITVGASIQWNGENHRTRRVMALPALRGKIGRDYGAFP